MYSALPRSAEQPKRAEIHLSALRANYRLLKKRLAEAHENTDSSTVPRKICVVKADAYGHGAPQCVRVLLEEGCDFFAVSCIEEGISVRAICDQARRNAEILVFGYTAPCLAASLSEHRLIQSLLSLDYARELNAAAKSAKVCLQTHLAVDTGMNRIGFCAHTDALIARAAEDIARVCKLPALHVAGMFTHFACADDMETDGDGARISLLQAARYRDLCRLLTARGIEIPFHHTCNSAAAMRFPQLHFDGVRLGILLYGVCPVRQMQIPVHPVMRLQTEIIHLHTSPAGEGIGYGAHARADSERLIATLPIGYADGFLRAYSGATVTVHTRSGDVRAPIVGNVCMDQCMLDVSGTAACVGDAVTLFGTSPAELDALAKRADSIPYETLCLISSRVCRVYSDGDELPTEPNQKEG
ncbi:MAG: alanine racemase [Clostridia bacterium]|nr:alanine racemase [Clostridia bacterium]